MTPELDALAAEARSRAWFVWIAAASSSSRQAYGLADRRWGVPNATDTRFAIASGVKGMTALVVVSLVEDGALDTRHHRALAARATIFRSSRTT